MAKINLTPKKIYEQEFKTSIRGYDKTEVDEFLDDVIKDYTVYIALVKELQEENAKLRLRQHRLLQAVPHMQVRQVNHHMPLPILLRLQTMIS